jgi:hypothetical protein
MSVLLKLDLPIIFLCAVELAEAAAALDPSEWAALRGHDLTYQSRQEARQTERLFGRLGFDAEVAKIWERMHRKK